MRSTEKTWKPFSFGRVELEDGKYSFLLLEGRRAEITAYRGHENMLVIPDEIGGIFQVTRIGKYAFSDRDISTMIFVPENVTYIGEGAFEGCSRAEFIDIPRGITYIGSRAFKGCKRIQKMEIPCIVEHIGNDAFEECQDICLLVCEGSLAEHYARDNHMKYHLMFNEFEYMILDDDTIVILDCNSEEEEIHIPEMIRGRRVSAVDKRVHCGFYTLRVIVPENVVEVDMNT